jgi:hypothetical protein
MDTSINDGGPAFARSGLLLDNGDWVAPQDGMTLRDWFAGQALAHIPELLDAHDANKSAEMIAHWSYQIADAMLKARREVQHG